MSKKQERIVLDFESMTEVIALIEEKIKHMESSSEFSAEDPVYLAYCNKKKDLQEQLSVMSPADDKERKLEKVFNTHSR